METRELKINLTLEKAKKWYNSGNSELKSLALNVFSENILRIPSIEDILSNINDISEDERKNLENKFEAHSKFVIIARYLNDGWTKTVDSPSYIVCMNNNFSKPYVKEDLHHHIKAGTVYFKERELAEIAIELMGSDINLLF